MLKEIKLIEFRKRVEDLGVLIEKFDRTPVTSRVFAYLLISDPPEKTFQEICDFLKASKSTISVSLKFLQSEGTVTYKTYSGDRKKYFRVDVDGWRKSILDREKLVQTFNSMFEQIIDYRKGSEDQEFNKDLSELLDFSKYLNETRNKAIKEWNK